MLLGMSRARNRYRWSYGLAIVDTRPFCIGPDPVIPFKPGSRRFLAADRYSPIALRLFLLDELARVSVGAMPHGSCAVGNVTYEHRPSRCSRPRPDLDMNWKALDFDQITARELYLILRARSAVFVVEQSHVHLDPDGRDETSLHVFAVDDISRPMPVIAYARLREGASESPEVVVDKILTSPLRRSDGTAEALIERVLAATRERWPGRLVCLVAPVDLRGFYEAFGF